MFKLKHSVQRISIGVAIGLLIAVGLIWLLSKTLGNGFNTLYAGKPIAFWQEQLNSHDAGASNQAFATVNVQVIPQLLDTMFHDTNDSNLRLSLIDTLNGLPGVRIDFIQADARRAAAVECLGELGPPAFAAVPDLIRALQWKDGGLLEAAITALGRIHSAPETVIPLLILYLEDDNLDVPAATALAEFGSLAKPAVPKLLPLLHAKDGDDRAAARKALLKIDPAAVPREDVNLKTPKATN